MLAYLPELMIASRNLVDVLKLKHDSFSHDKTISVTELNRGVVWCQPFCSLDYHFHSKPVCGCAFMILFLKNNN